MRTQSKQLRCLIETVGQCYRRLRTGIFGTSLIDDEATPNGITSIAENFLVTLPGNQSYAVGAIGQDLPMKTQIPLTSPVLHGGALLFHLGEVYTPSSKACRPPD